MYYSSHNLRKPLEQLRQAVSHGFSGTCLGQNVSLKGELNRQTCLAARWTWGGVQILFSPSTSFDIMYFRSVAFNRPNCLLIHTTVKNARRDSHDFLGFPTAAKDRNL